MNYILQFTTGEKFIISQQEAELISKANDNQSITIKRLGMVVQKRMCLIYPEHSADRLEERRKQQTGILHDGTNVKKHFGQWIFDNGFVPDDNGDYQPIRLDREYYPEIALDAVATEEEFLKIKETGQNYYEFLGIADRTKRLNNRGFSQLLE
jgi:hypothetical protein